MSGRNHNQYTQLRAQWRLGSRGSAAEWIPCLSRLICAAALLLSLIACASGPRLPPAPKLPYPAWYIGFAAPKHMEVWVETADVLDRRGLAFFRVHGGVASYTGKVEGWHQGGAGGKPINNVDLPDLIFLRWQSLVEPQSYKIKVQIPQWVRDEMVRPEKAFCLVPNDWKEDYRNVITLGMTPGGIVKVWVGGPCLGFKEVGRYQAKLEPLGPNQDGKGLFYRPPNPAAQAWIDQHGIPYGSW
ncbi:hypothetical protein FX982_04902 [Pseudomonas graminis]|uniref:DUF2931 family protein n=2 Tax=Pseudomonas graminis TaxID=158627 RepID=A0A6M8MYL8_9PSED|nr:hypothetical protein FX982_04902 [Pseudomonas graminis]